jgi:hypothetical protein
MTTADAKGEEKPTERALLTTYIQPVFTAAVVLGMTACWYTNACQPME